MLLRGSAVLVPPAAHGYLPAHRDRPPARLPARSGGQRKRVNIGLEVCVKPSLLFLDEPTSGLDSTAAQDIMGALTRMARLGMSVISVCGCVGWVGVGGLLLLVVVVVVVVVVVCVCVGGGVADGWSAHMAWLPCRGTHPLRLLAVTPRR